MEFKNIYCCLHRTRSKDIERLIATDDICIHDQIDVVYMSSSYNKAKSFFDSIKPFDNEFWYSTDKYLVMVPADTEIEEGVVNEEMIEHVLF